VLAENFHQHKKRSVENPKELKAELLNNTGAATRGSLHTYFNTHKIPLTVGDIIFVTLGETEA
jgi:hypothetical protein